jgi:pentatricopeptide repeat protein
VLFSHAQSNVLQNRPDSGWIGLRIIMLKGLGEVNTPSGGIKQLPNIVAHVVKVEGDKVWLQGPGIEPAGWLHKDDVVLLNYAVSYFSLIIEKQPANWDAWFRRADAQHALNKRKDALLDYSAAIRLHPKDAYLYARRARCYQADRQCKMAIADYDTAISLNPAPAFAADAYSRQSTLYASCPDTSQQNAKMAIVTAEKAIGLDSSRITYRTILATAYARNREFEKAAQLLKQMLASPGFPPGYRDEAMRQLQAYEKRTPGAQ